MKHAIMIAALALASVGAGLHAQSTAPNTITLKTCLPDSNNDKVVKVSAAGAKRYGVPSTGNWYGPLKGYPACTYSKTKPVVEPAPVPTPTPSPTPTPTPEPTPTPTPEPAPVTQTVVISPVPIAAGGGTEAFFLKDGVVAAMAPDGHIGSKGPAPVGWPRMVTNYARVALSVPSRADPLIIGPNVEGFSVAGSRDGARVLWRNIAGAGDLPRINLTADGTWTGAAKGLEIVQRPVVFADGVRIGITVKNTGATRLADVRYLRTAAFTDYERVFSTASTIVGTANIEAGLLGRSKGRFAFLRTDDSRFESSVFGFINDNPDAIAPLPIGYKVTGNLSANLIGYLGDLEPGASTSFAIEIGVR